MPNTPNPIDLMLDRRALVDLRALVEELIARIEAIESKYAPGEIEVVDVEVDLTPLPIHTHAQKKQANKRQPKLSLSEAILTHLKDNPSIDIHAFSAAHPSFKKQHMYGMLAGLAKRSKPLIIQDKENRAIYHRL